MRTVRDARRSLRGLVLLSAAALLLIAGVLAMHTFTAEPAGHGAVPSARAAAAHPHDSAEHTTAVTVPVESDVGHGHDDMLMACVLALLVAMLLVLPPILLGRRGAFAHGLAYLHSGSSTGVLPRPPSLICLSISRT